MKLKRIISALLSAVIFATAFCTGSVTASAASKELALITVPFTSISERNEFFSLGRGVYATTKGFVRIGADEMKAWRKTGKLKPTKIKTDLKFPANWKAYGLLDKGNYITVDTLDRSGKRTGYTLLKYSEKNNEIKTVRTYSSGSWKYVTADGYVALQPIEDLRAGTFTIRFDTPDGKMLRNTFTTTYYRNDGYNYMPWTIIVPGFGSYLYVTYTLSEEQPSQSNYGDKVYRVKIFGITRKGTENLLADYYASHYSMLYSDNFDNIFYTSQIKPDNVNFFLNNGSTKNTVKFGTVRSDYSKAAYNGKEDVSGELNDIISIKNNKAIAYYTPFGQLYRGSYGFYRLLDVSGESASYISEPYKDMYVDTYTDGKLYWVENAKGKQGFINDSGKELAMFDLAAPFRSGSKGTAVVKNKNVYMVDKKMKRVSAKIKGDKVASFSGTPDLYEIRIANDYYFMTYATEDPNPSAPDNVSSSGKVTIKWSKVKNIDGYEIFMSTNKNSDYKILAIVNNPSKTSYVKTGLTSGRTYYFKIRTFKVKDGKKVYSDFSKPQGIKAT